MSVNNHDAVLNAITASLAQAMPARFVQRSLVDPADVPTEQLLASLLCVVTESGGNFANYRGREADLGSMAVRLVGFVKVEEGQPAVATESAELALLGDLLTWLNTIGVPGLDVIYPGDWTCSKQLEHPYGWLALALQVKT